MTPDERASRHRLVARGEAPGTGLVFDLAVTDGPARRSADLRIAIVGLVDHDPACAVVLVETGIEPSSGRWEFRTSGLWAEVFDESEHWSYGLEAFALEIDDPAELLGRGYGKRVALGWELDLIDRPTGSRLEGLLLHGRDEHEISLPAELVIPAPTPRTTPLLSEDPGTAVALPNSSDTLWV